MTSRWDVKNPTNRQAMLEMRLRKPVGEVFEYFASHVESETVYLFLFIRGQPVIVEDTAASYPSDTLMAQLALMA